MKKLIELPTEYSKLNARTRKLVRERYAKDQEGKCLFCQESLENDPPKIVTEKKIDWSYFPPFFLKYPVHLQHNHDTDMTEGAVHAYCNAVLWQYHGI